MSTRVRRAILVFLTPMMLVRVQALSSGSTSVPEWVDAVDVTWSPDIVRVILRAKPTVSEWGNTPLPILIDTVEASWIRERIAKPEYVELDSCVIVGDIFAGFDTVWSPIMIEHCVFSDPVRASNVTFRKVLSFSHCYFPGGVDLRNVAFYMTDFEHCVFNVSRFDSTDFPRTSFRESIFLGRVSFHNIRTMESDLFFRHVDFRHGAEITPLTERDTLRCDFRATNVSGLQVPTAALDEYSMSTLSSASGLRNMDMKWSADLTPLRKYFREYYYRQAEREITCAMMRHNATPLQTVLFDWPFEYGSNLARPFRIVGYIFSVCTLLYSLLFLLASRLRKHGAYLLTTERETEEHEPKTTATRIAWQPIHSGRLRWLLQSWQLVQLLTICLLFSLFTTFNVSFRDASFGGWLRLLPFKKVDFEAFGLVRTLSGLQGILSILLMAFGLLFYFGRFFD